MKTKLILLSVAILFAGCAADNKEQPATATTATHAAPARTNLNVSIFLDLSDRIDPVKNASRGMEFYQRDLGYIAAIAKGFEKHVRSKRIISMNDQIQVFFEPEPLDARINELAKGLKFSFTKANTTKAAIEQIVPQYQKTTADIYQLAIKGRTYVGSDIWGFMKNKVNDYCIRPQHRNILFILTDGYMFHKDSKFLSGTKSSYLTPELVRSLKLNNPDFKATLEKKGYGFIPANDSLKDLEVVVIGVNPAKGNPFEGDVINAYWMDWLQAMNVSKPVNKPFSAALPSDLSEIIQAYINR